MSPDLFGMVWAHVLYKFLLSKEPGEKLNRLAARGVLVACALTLMGCVSANSSDRSASTPSGSPTVPGAGAATSTSGAPTTAATPQALTTTVGNFTMMVPGGYTAAGIMHVGPPQHETTLQTGDVTLGSACGLNPQTDAAIPWDLTVTNSTSDFSLTGLELSVGLAGPKLWNHE